MLSLKCNYDNLFLNVNTEEDILDLDDLKIPCTKREITHHEGKWFGLTYAFRLERSAVTVGLASKCKQASCYRQSWDSHGQTKLANMS
eukprot:1088616-Amphidinium_carterae.1